MFFEVREREAEALARTITEILEAAGWEVSLRMSLFDMIASGITLIQTERERNGLLPCAETLWTALDSIGMKPDLTCQDGPKDLVTLLIGQKP